MEQNIDQFLRFLSVEKGFSPNTLSAYRNDLSQFASFVEEKNGPTAATPAAVDREAILSYLLHLKERSYSPATVARKVSAVKSFFKFLEAEVNTFVVAQRMSLQAFVHPMQSEYATPVAGVDWALGAASG